MNHPSKQSEIKRLISDKKLDLVSIIETKVFQANVVSIHRSLCPSWSLIHNYPYSPLGRIWVLWNPNQVNFKVIDTSRQAIHCSIFIIGQNITFFTSFIYAANMATERQLLWENIIHFAGLFSHSPWLIMGDFNIIPNTAETFGGSRRRCQAMDEFKDCLQQAELDDLKFSSILFSWSNKSQGAACISDRSPILVTMNFNIPHRSTAMFQVVQKLKMLKLVLRANYKKEFSEIDSKLHYVKLELDSCQLDLDKSPNDVLLREMERSLISEYLRLRKIQEDMLRQKSRMNWLKLGDCNSSFFHKSLSSRNNRKKIVSLTLDSGQIIDDMDSIKLEVVSHFQNLLGCSPPTIHHLSDLTPFFSKQVPHHLLTYLDDNPTPTEIRNYITSVSVLKSAIDHFCTMSGLAINLNKSSIFFSGTDQYTESCIISLLGIGVGTLPIRYLGVPLISTNLKTSHCSLLIEKITHRITHWTSRSLSYTGRLQLIKAILVSTQLYWSGIFILPKAVINKLNSIFSAFL
ncbi:uncharacterized protein LOC132276560 [Cornus florida]|uniref:uncharacterized protein LOC132276560 n=1 Tax=Cornus florida TaxID=4283 RepID=UPI002896ADA6|nr:uncharacterized protein LOC132276560 [Cornus florida]